MSATSNIFSRQNATISAYSGGAEWPRTRLTSRVLCSVIMSCYLVKRSRRRGLQSNNGGSLSRGGACDELIKASLSKRRFVAIAQAAWLLCAPSPFVLTTPWWDALCTEARRLFVFRSAPMVSHYVAG